MQRHQLVSVSFDRGDFKGWVMFLTPKTRGMQQPDTRSEPKWAVEKLIFWSRQNFGCVKRGTSPADIHQPLLGWQPGRKHLGEVLRTKTTMPWSALGLIFNTRWPRVVSSMKERLESSQDLLGAGADLRDLLSKLAPYSRILGSCALASAVTNCVPDPNHAERYKASLKAGGTSAGSIDAENKPHIGDPRSCAADCSCHREWSRERQPEDHWNRAEAVACDLRNLDHRPGHGQP